MLQQCTAFQGSLPPVIERYVATNIDPLDRSLVSAEITTTASFDKIFESLFLMFKSKCSNSNHGKPLAFEILMKKT